jgi:general secretion pathway protein J
MDERQGGFTLLEVLIALVLLGLLLAGLGAALRFGFGLWELQARQIAGVDALDATDRALRALVEQMEPGDPGLLQPTVSGSSDRLSFIGQLPQAVVSGRRADMTLIVASGGRLVVRWRPHRHERPFGAPPAESETLLLQGVDRLDLAYWRADAPGRPGGWTDRWDEPGLPALVRVRLRFPPGDARHWPDLLIAPLLSSRAY